MTQPVENLVTAVAVLVDAVTGILQVPVNPPETVSVPTFAIVYLRSGTIDNGVIGMRKALHTINIDVLTKRTDLSRDMAKVKPFLDLVPAALLADPTLTATAQTFDNITYELLVTDYGGVPMIGYKFSINGIKVLTA